MVATSKTKGTVSLSNDFADNDDSEDDYLDDARKGKLKSVKAIVSTDWMEDSVDSYRDSGYSSGEGGNSSNESEEEKREAFAVKVIKKAKFYRLGYTSKQEMIETLQQEIKLLETIQFDKKRRKRKAADHVRGEEYIIDLLDIFEDRNYIYMVTNFCSGGNLWDWVEKKENITEEEIRHVMLQIYEGISYLHHKNIAHLDLKPDNVVFTQDSAHPEARVQIIDFGMSRMIPPLYKSGVLVGTPHFIAPEVIGGFYDKKADVWSLGVILFFLRFGYPPFFTTHEKVQDFAGDTTELYEKIHGGFDPTVRSGLGAWFPDYVEASDTIKDLIAKTLVQELHLRYTIDECLDHKFFREHQSEKRLPKTVIDSFLKFSGECRFRVMISHLFAHQIEPGQKLELKRVWDEFDVDGDGRITLDEFKSVMKKFGNYGYKDYQIEAMFENLDVQDKNYIKFDDLMAAYSYQRLVAVDERMWEAFQMLDVDGDGQITKVEIANVLQKIGGYKTKVNIFGHGPLRGPGANSQLAGNSHEARKDSLFDDGTSFSMGAGSMLLHKSPPMISSGTIQTDESMKLPSGMITISEEESKDDFKVLKKGNGMMSSADLQRMLRRETDGQNGEPSLEEVMTGAFQIMKRNHSRKQSKFNTNARVSAFGIKGHSTGLTQIMQAADWDENGMIDYEEFLRTLHPAFNEAPITPESHEPNALLVDDTSPFELAASNGQNTGSGKERQSVHIKHKKKYSSVIFDNNITKEMENAGEERFSKFLKNRVRSDANAIASNKEDDDDLPKNVAVNSGINPNIVYERLQNKYKGGKSRSEKIQPTVF